MLASLITHPSGLLIVGIARHALTFWLASASSSASRSIPVPGRHGISSARIRRLSIICSTPKYAGDSIATVSPGCATARRHRFSASIAPTVVTRSSAVSAQPCSTERRAIWRRNAGQPGGGS